MAHPTESPSAGKPRRRADAERSIARILDGALDALASDPEASMAEIARRAGVVRATIYVHFPTREALIAAITDRGVTEVAEAIAAASPERGDPVEALRRVVSEAWRKLGRYHALVEINSRLPQAELHDRHHSALAALEPLIERGQRAGAFRSDVPAAWHLAMMLALIHAASAELQAGRMSADEVEAALLETVVGAVSERLPAFAT
jgi:AcrR family transcriptional regulator